MATIRHNFKNSSHVAGFRYDQATRTVEVSFQDSRKVYRHENVPDEAITNWTKDASAGKFYHRIIRKHYPAAAEKD